MNQNLRMASDFYRVARGKKPAARMLLHAAAGMTLLIVWASLAPVTDTVTHVAKIVSKNEFGAAKDGAVSLSSALSGKVVAVACSEQQEVSKGDVLVRIDPSEFTKRREMETLQIESLGQEVVAKEMESKLAVETYLAQKSELEAQLSAERRKSEKLASERTIKIESAQSELIRAKKALSRSRKLSSQRAISQAELDTSEADYRKAKEALSLAKLPLDAMRIVELESQIKSLESSHAENVHRINSEKLALENRIAIARSEFDLLSLKIDQCVIHAPIDGHVSTCDLSVGDWVSPGPIGVTVSQAGFVGEVLLPSRAIGNVKLGDAATIYLDGLDWIVNGTLKAKVASVSPELCHEEVVQGDGSTMVVDGYRVLLELESNEDFEKWDSIRIGMTGSVQIETGQKKLAIYLLEKAVGNALFARQ